MKYKIVTLIAGLLSSLPVFAYIGPGMGLGTIGVIIGVIVSVFLAIIAIIWYPLKRVFRKLANKSQSSAKIPDDDKDDNDSLSPRKSEDKDAE